VLNAKSKRIVMALLRLPGFRSLLAGFFLSTFAAWASRTAVLIWVYALTHSGVMVSLVGLAEALPLLLLAPIAGVFVDRWSRARTMAGAVVCQAAGLVPLLLVHDKAGIPIILAVTLLVNAAAQFLMPAANAAIPAVVGQEAIGPANSLVQLINSLVLIASPGLASVLYAAIGPHGLVLALIGIYLLAVPLLASVPAPRPDKVGDAGTSVLTEMRDGLRYVRRSRLLSSLIVVAFVALLGVGALGVLDVVFVNRALHLRAETVGVLFAANGLGQLLGGLAIFALGTRLADRYHLLLGLAVLANGLALVGYALAPSLLVAALAVFLSGIAFTPLIISFMTILQLAAEDAYMGRVNSLVNTGMAVAMLLSLSSGGALADLFGVRQVIGGGAAILALAGLLSLAMIRATPVRQPAIEEPLAEALSA